MDKHARRIEQLKNVLIVLLLCSALLLISQSTLYQEFQRLLGVGESAASARPSGSLGGNYADIEVRPSQIIIRCPDGRYGVQYDGEAIGQIYDNQLGFRLKEAVSGVREVKQITEEVWRAKLLGGEAWVYFDFPGTLPLLELSAWLSQERDNPALSGSVSALLLEETAEGLFLCYRNEADGQYYQSGDIGGRENPLATLLTAYSANGAMFVFEQESYAEFMNPYTIFLPREKRYPVYSVRNPFEEADDETWAQILRTLSFNPKVASYQVVQGTRAQLEGDESLRLLADGTLIYENLNSANPKYVVEEPTIRSQTEYAKGLLDLVTQEHLGDGGSYLAAVEQEGTLLTVRFFYDLGGVPVQLGRDGHAAEFQFEGGVLTGFEIHTRSYQKTEAERAPMPVKQAIASFRSLQLQGRELILSYLDSGENGDLMIDWTAVN